VQVVDFWHFVKKLGAAAPLLNGEASRHLATRMRLLYAPNVARSSMLELRMSRREDRRVGDTRALRDAIT
jgi:hypothetical protein